MKSDWNGGWTTNSKTEPGMTLSSAKLKAKCGGHRRNNNGGIQAWRQVGAATWQVELIPLAKPAPTLPSAES